MTSQTTLPSILRNSSSAGSVASRHSGSSFSFGTIIKLPIGSRNVELDIMSMAPPSEEQFMRSSCFEHLVSVLHDNHNSFTITELTAALCHALPINTSTASETAHHLCTPILTAPYDVSTLNFRGFCTHRGIEVQVSKTFLTNRPENLLYASFDCTIDPSTIDTRITLPPFNFAFCLRLPQTTQTLTSTTTTSAPTTSSTTTPTNTSTQVPSTPPPRRTTKDSTSLYSSDSDDDNSVDNLHVSRRIKPSDYIYELLCERVHLSPNVHVIGHHLSVRYVIVPWSDSRTNTPAYRIL